MPRPRRSRPRRRGHSRCGAAAGWYGLDPTNAVLAGDDHLVVAIGRDYSDVAPVGGVVFASGKQKIDEAVSVMPVRAA